MGLLETIKPNIYNHCPECKKGEIREETSNYGFSLEGLYCANCGYEPEQSEVLDDIEGMPLVGDGENATDNKSVYVCRECHEEVSPDIKRCPNCGWKPKKKGGLWWGATALMSLNPIGWAMGAKGASDGIKAGKGVAKKVNKTEKTPDSETREDNSKPPTEKLDELGELREKDVITEEEFEEKKKELLNQI